MISFKKSLKIALGIMPWQENTALQQKQINSYLTQHRIRKLQFGCGPNYLEGWLNTDIVKGFKDVIYLDITQKLPLPSNSIDYMTSEHLIEHINFKEGKAFLQECLRVLKPNGVVRLITPDLATLLNLYQDNSTEGKKYTDFMVQRFVPEAKYDFSVFVINNAFRNWGHQFIYDKSTLVNLLTEVGFTNIKETKPGISDHQPLTDIDVRHKSEISGINSFEVMVFEFEKPADQS